MHLANHINFIQHTHTYTLTKEVNNNFRIFKLEPNEKCNGSRNDHKNGNKGGLHCF